MAYEEFEDTGDGDKRLLGTYSGVVADNVDPLSIGRVRVSIPGLFDKSPWATPEGTCGGGSAARGILFVPQLDADVVVRFLNGDPAKPVYSCGSWGEDEALTPHQAVEASEVPEIDVIETKRWLIVLDNREGRETLTIADKEDEADEDGNPTGIVELDGVNHSITLRSAGPLLLASLTSVSIDAPGVYINKRWVSPGDKPI